MNFARRHKGTAGVFLFAVVVVSLYSYWGSVMLERQAGKVPQGQVSEK